MIKIYTENFSDNLKFKELVLLCIDPSVGKTTA